MEAQNTCGYSTRDFYGKIVNADCLHWFPCPQYTSLLTVTTGIKRNNKDMDIISLIVLLLIVGLVVWFAFWMVDASGIPSPFNWLIKGIVLILGLLWLFGGGHFGGVPSLHL